MKWPIPVLALAALILVAADALAFHDLLEPHTVTDWLMLAASALVVLALAGTVLGPRRRGESLGA